MKVRRGYTATSFGQIHYRYAGTAGQPVVVLLHQTPSTSEMFDELMLALAGNYRLLAPDTPGMGLSDPVDGEMTVASLAEAILEFLDELGIDRCHLFGHHTGAAIAAELAATHPDRIDMLALSGPTLLDDATPGTAARSPRGQFPVESDGGHLVKMWQRINGKDTHAPLDIVQRETLSGVALGENYPAAYEAVIAHDMAKALSSLSCPVLVFAGTQDVLFGRLDAAYDLLANGSKSEIADAGTFVCETHSPDVAAMLRDFFQEGAA